MAKAKDWSVPGGDDPTTTEHPEGMQANHGGKGIYDGVGNESRPLANDTQQENAS